METQSAFEIIRATTDAHYNQVQDLIRAFVHWHRQRHTGTTLTSDYYDNDAFEQELASLPAIYGRDRNRLLLALYKGQPAGCVALRELEAQTCEMKRMFVYAQYHGKGIGRALVQELMREAKGLGYRVMKLNTSTRQVEAQKLYGSLGFKRTAAYAAMPEKLMAWLVFMERKL